MDALLQKLNRLTQWQAAVILAALGLVVFCSGLGNPFQGDDIPQIVANPVVHSIAHVKVLLEGSTFYTGGGIAPLGGDYYRPLMSVVFAALYSAFGPHAVFFHLLQLALCVGSAILLYLLFEAYFGTLLALVLAAIFLVHPLNSQVAFAIPSMQDALFFFFGIAALRALQRSRSTKTLWLASGSLLLSLLAKESGVYFVAVALLFVWWSDRKRLGAFAATTAVPLIVYALLKAHAVGLAVHSAGYAPIDNLSVAGRLLTAPSILLFYLTRFIFPWKLATAYYWTYPTFSWQHFVLPLAVDLAAIALVIYMAVRVGRKAGRDERRAFVFFAAWAGLGVIGLLQLVPLDMTACETWFYFPMAGVLGMIGVVLVAWQKRIRPAWFAAAAVALLTAFACRTMVRALDYRTEQTLAVHDVAVSREDFNAYNNLAYILNTVGDYPQAAADARRSLAIFPTYFAYRNLGVALQNTGDYAGAADAFQNVGRYAGAGSQAKQEADEQLAGLTLLTGSYAANRQLLLDALQEYPQDGRLWMYLAILEDAHGHTADAHDAIQRAAADGQAPQALYDAIMANQPFTLKLDIGKIVSIP